MESKWQFDDAWLLAATVVGSRVVQADLAGVLFAADYLNHGVPPLELLNGFLGRLTVAGLVLRGTSLLPSSTAIALWDEASADRPVSEAVRRLEELLGERVPPPVGSDPWAISGDAYADALALYRRRFSEALGQSADRADFENLSEVEQDVQQVLLAFELTRAEMMPVLRWQVLHNRANYRWFVIPGIVLTAIGLGLTLSTRGQTGTLSLAGLLLLGRFVLMLIRTPGSAWRKAPGLHQQLILAFSPEGVRLTGRASTSFTLWSAYSDLIDLGTVKLLKLRGRKAFLYLPMRAFRTQADQQLVSALASGGGVESATRSLWF